MRTLIHHENYKKQCELLGGYARMMSVHAAIEWALSIKAEVYDVIEGTDDIRLLKTNSAGDATDLELPGFAVWFRIKSGKEVELLHIEKRPDDSDDSES